MTPLNRLVLLSLLLAAGVILNVFETLYLPPLPVPGAKVGLAHIITLFLVAFFSLREALINLVLRVVVASLATGTFLTTLFFFSLGGALVSYLVMALMYSRLGGRLSLLGVSVAGAVTHNLTQLALAVWLLGTWGIALHLPFLVIVGVITGSFNGLLANALCRRMAAVPASDALG